MLRTSPILQLDSTSPTDWLPQTKFQLPRLHSDTIRRPQLLDALHHAIIGHHLTLISAPAGYGKTTLLNSWAHSVIQTALGMSSNVPPETTVPQKGKNQRRNSLEPARNQARVSSTQKDSPVQIAWFSLDIHDNDPTHFLLGLIAAFRPLNAHCGAAALSLLSASSYPELASPTQQAQYLVGLLINDILEHLPNTLVLIIEDCHHITEPTVHATLDYLLERLPPNMHLIISTRQDPPLALSRLRAMGQLAEFQLDDLAFTDDESNRFLNQQLHASLSSADMSTLYNRTEGWPAGLRLLVTSLDSLHGPTEQAAFINHFSLDTTGDNPIGLNPGGIAARAYIFNYLADEVLGQQDPDLRTFLLQTSILPELTPAICKAVTLRDDTAVILRDLHQRNMFLVSVEPEQGLGIPTASGWLPSLTPTYRYHDLFTDFLRYRLNVEMPEQVSELHRRAAEVETSPARKITHALAASQWQLATELIEQIGEQLVQQNLVEALTTWISALPEAVQKSHPKLLYLRGICLWKRNNQLANAQVLLEEALQGFMSANDEVGQGQTLVDMATCALHQADFKNSQALVDRALTYSLTPANQVQILMNRTWLSIYATEWEKAEHDFNRAVTITDNSPDARALRILTTYLSPSLTVLAGGLQHIEHICNHPLLKQTSIDPFWARRIGQHLAYVHLQRGKLDLALQMAWSAVDNSEQMAENTNLTQMDAVAILAIVHMIRNNYIEANRLFDQLIDGVNLTPFSRPTLAIYLYLCGRSYWLQDRQQEAHEIAERIAEMESEGAKIQGWMTLVGVLQPMLLGLLAISERNYKQGEIYLKEASSKESLVPIATFLGSPQLMLAYLYIRWDQPQKALDEFTPILAECEKNNTPGIILQEGKVMIPLLRLAAKRSIHTPFAMRLLGLLGITDVPSSLYIPETDETLTPRQVKVLQLIAGGATNRTIGTQLDITHPTVKSHVSQILRKLNVTSRDQAGVRARELGLVRD